MARNTAKRRPHIVAAVVTHGVSPFELSVACEVFGLDRSELVDPWYQLLVCAAVEPPIRAKTSHGLTIDTPYRLADLERAGTIVVPMWNADDEPGAELVDALRAADHRGARILSFCSGAFLLAHAGLLDGRRATTHWMYADLLSQRFPAISVEPDVLYVVDGTVMTSAGTAAAIDLCLHVVRHDHGAEVANAVARRMVVPPHRDGGQAQFIQAPVPTCAEVDDPFRSTLDWAVEHLDEQLTVEVLARRAATSPRTFAAALRGRHRHDAAAVAAAPARPAGPAPARDDRRTDRADRRAVRLRDGGWDARPLPAAGRHQPHPLPPDLPSGTGQLS